MKGKDMKINSMNTIEMRNNLNKHLESIKESKACLDINIGGQDDEIYFLERVSNRISDLLDDLDYYDNCKRKKLVIQRQ